MSKYTYLIDIQGQPIAEFYYDERWMLNMLQCELLHDDHVAITELTKDIIAGVGDWEELSEDEVNQQLAVLAREHSIPAGRFSIRIRRR